MQPNEMMGLGIQLGLQQLLHDYPAMGATHENRAQAILAYTRGIGDTNGCQVNVTFDDDLALGEGFVVGASFRGAPPCPVSSPPPPSREEVAPQYNAFVKSLVEVTEATIQHFVENVPEEVVADTPSLIGQACTATAMSLALGLFGLQITPLAGGFLVVHDHEGASYQVVGLR